MKKKKLIIALAIVMITTLLMSSTVVASSKPEKSTGTPVPALATDEILVKVKPGGNIQQVLTLFGGNVTRSFQKSGIQKIKLPPGTSITTAMLQYGNNSNVEYAEPNYKRKATYLPNDPGLSDQWYVNTIKAPQAWDITQGSPSIVVALIDTGIDPNHPDLSNKIISTFNSLNGSTDPIQAKDTEGHGTHVSGIIAAAMNNGQGIAGIGGNVRLMPIKADNSAGEFSDSDVINGIYYAVDHGAKAINMSLGGPGASTTLQNAVNYAISHNVTVVAAAGNDNTNVPSYPAACTGVIAVASTDSNDARSTFSNYGSWITVSSPGESILSDFPTYGISTPNGVVSNYAIGSGTSMASPIVTGLAGLLLSVNPALTPNQITDLITKNALDLGTPGRDDYFGAGRVDAYKTLLALTDKTPPSVVSTNPQNNMTNVPLASNILINFSEAIASGVAYNNITLSDNNSNQVSISKQLNGSTLSITPTGQLKANTSYTVNIPTGAVTDLIGNNIAAYSFSFSTVVIQGSTVTLPFDVTDAVKDPNRPVVYASNKANQKVYAINYSTGTITPLSFSQMPEHLVMGQGIYANELYVGLLNQEHQYYTTNQLSGNIAVIDTQSFTLKDTINTTIDPDSIVAGRDGNIYVVSGSNQWTTIDSYNRVSKQRIAQTGTYMRAVAKLHPTMEKIYTLDTGLSPIDIHAYNTSNGTFTDPTYPGGYDSPYHGDYPMNNIFGIDPKGQYLFNGTGHIFKTTSSKTDDMTHVGQLNTGFTAIAFEPDSSKFYTTPTNSSGIYVYDGSTFVGTATINLQGQGQYLFRGNGELVAVFTPATQSMNFKAGIQVIPTGIHFPDPKLDAAVRTALNKTNEDITTTDLANLTALDVSGLGITDLSGLEQAVNLANLNISNNNITNIGVIGVLNNLTKLDMQNNQITTLPSFANLKKLTDLNLSSNSLKDVSGLSVVTSLVNLNLSVNAINQIGVLNSLPNLKNVDLTKNPLGAASDPIIKALQAKSVVVLFDPLDLTPPALNITSPSDKSLTNKGTVNVSGSTEIGSRVTVNGNPTILDSQNNFISTVNLTMGSNSIEVIATDIAGNTSTVRLTINRVQPLSAVGTLPAKNTIAVPVDQTITITFNKNISQSTNFNNIVLLDNGLNTVPVTLNVSGNLLTIKPNNLLAGLSNYSVNIPQGSLIDSDGLSLDTSLTAVTSFKTTVLPLDSSTRLYGSDRLSTAIAISKKMMPRDYSADAVLLATGLDFPDALAGAALGKIKNAPLLLVLPNYNDSLATINEVNRVLKPGGTIYILGGVGVVPTQYESAFGSKFLVKRLAGPNRYSTAVAIAKEIKQTGSGEVIIATGLNFPDSLSISPYAVKNGVPLVLVDPQSLPTDTENYLRNLNPSVITIVGKEGAVSSSVEARLTSIFPNASLRRLGGVDRFDTSSIIAKTLFGNSCSTVFAATGYDFPDALSGSVFAGYTGSPLVLVEPNQIPSYIINNYLNTLTGKNVGIFGGPGVVSDSVMYNLINLIK